MAKDTQGKVATPEEPVPPPQADCPETQAVFDNFRTDCADEKGPLALNEASVAQAKFGGAFSVVCEDRRSLNKGEATRRIYSNIHYNVAIGLCKDIEEVQKQVAAQMKAAEELGKKFAAAVGTLKDASTKVKAAQLLANEWNKAVSQSCKLQSRNAADDILKEKFKDTTPVPTIKGSAEKLETMAIDLVDIIDNAIETAVKVSGVYTFTNVSSLKPYTDKLKGQCDQFKGDSETNLNDAEKKVTSARKSLAEDLPKMSEAELLWRKECADWDAIIAIVNYLSVRDPQPTDDLETICRKVDKGLTDPVPGPGGGK